MVGAALFDLAQRRIPNRLIALGLACGVLSAGLTGDLAAIGGALLGMAVALGMLIVPFARGWMGGGDVKLLMVCGAFTGWMGTLEILLIGTAVHGVISMGWLMARRAGKDLRGVPFAVAIAVATIAVVSDALPLPWR